MRRSLALALVFTCPLAAEAAKVVSGQTALKQIASHLHNMERRARDRSDGPEIQLQRVTGTAKGWLDGAKRVAVKRRGGVTRYTILDQGAPRWQQGYVITVAKRPNGNLYARTRAANHHDDQRAEIGRHGVATFLDGNGGVEERRPRGVLRTYLETGLPGARVTIQTEGWLVGAKQTVHLEALGAHKDSYFHKDLAKFPRPPKLP